MAVAKGELASAGSKKIPFQREPENVSPRGLFDAVEPKGSRKFLRAAVSAFSGRGYHATTTRDIAALVGSSPAGIYTYYATKADLMFEIAMIAHRYIEDVTDTALASVEDPAGRIAAMVRASVEYHAEEHVLVSVVNSDFRALDVTRLAKILKIRRKIGQQVRDEVQRGVDQGVFSVAHVDGAGIAILRLVDVASWYNERGQMTPAQLADVYVDLVLQMLGTSDGADDRQPAVHG